MPSAPLTPSSAPHGPRPTALVTGSARRLGRVIAERLAAEGWSLAIHYRESAAEADALVQALSDQGHRAASFQLDLDSATAADCQRLLASITESLGPVGLLVNNASRFEFDLATNFTADQLQRHLQSNLVGPLLLSQALYQDCLGSESAAAKTSETPTIKESPQAPQTPRAPQTPSAPRAVVIQLLDQKLVNPNPDFFSYTVSKHALEQASQLMARSFAPVLRVVGLSPGITLPSADQTEEEFQMTHRQTPLGQSSTAQEVADAVAWLAEARAITGTTLVVDGGQHLQPSPRDVMFSTR